MTDKYSKEKRSEIMSKIRSRGNKVTEIALANLLRRYNVHGWRRHQNIFGTPDFTFRKQRVVIFVDGCFWHGCPKHYRRPTTNYAYWYKKILSNKKRDKLVGRYLRNRGWIVLRIWEHDLTKNREKRCIQKIEQLLTQKLPDNIE